MSNPDSDSPAGAGVQEQFLTLLSREEAMHRFQSCLSMRPLGEETVELGASLGRVVARTLRSPIDVPPFDRALVDGFALRAEDIAQASEREPIQLSLNAEIIACGVEPRIEVASGTATRCRAAPMRFAWWSTPIQAGPAIYRSGAA
jgi:putative molybdopterin biosynthesis protein